jgi:4a-hydroxytetrahydrobiopterin dehydratase
MDPFETDDAMDADMDATLDPAALATAMDGLDGWRIEDDAIVRELRFDDFRAAIDAIVRIADLAEEANHHPELTNVYSRLTVRLTTHDAGGVTQKDLALARAIDAVVDA